jgi:predicted MFS family arabinose efflux permease
MPGAIGFAVNACTLGMAASGLAVALFGGRIDRRRGIIAALVLLALPSALLAHAPSLLVFALLRIAQGVFMAAAFALTLAYLGERCATASAFAAYITGNVASNLVGRLVAATLADQLGLVATFYAFAALNLAGALLVFLALPRVSTAERGRKAGPIRATAWSSLLRNKPLVTSLAIGFCILFAFIGTFTYVNFVLARAPFSVEPMVLGAIYLVFLPSIVTTPLSGIAAARIGTAKALSGSLAIAAAGLPLLLAATLTAVLAGLALVAIGTFAAQAIATGLVGRMAGSDRSAASGLYIASYFLGGLIGSAVLGQIFDRIGWGGCVVGIGSAIAAAALLTSYATTNAATE